MKPARVDCLLLPQQPRSTLTTLKIRKKEKRMLVMLVTFSNSSHGRLSPRLSNLNALLEHNNLNIHMTRKELTPHGLVSQPLSRKSNLLIIILPFDTSSVAKLGVFFLIPISEPTDPHVIITSDVTPTHLCNFTFHSI